METSSYSEDVKEALEGQHRASTTPCKFWVQGNCDRLDCPFLHSMRSGEGDERPSNNSHNYTSSGVSKKSIVCTFYAEGNCKNGAQCQYSHDDVQVEEYLRDKRHHSVSVDAGKNGGVTGIIFNSNVQNVRSSPSSSTSPASVPSTAALASLESLTLDGEKPIGYEDHRHGSFPVVSSPLSPPAEVEDPSMFDLSQQQSHPQQQQQQRSQHQISSHPQSNRHHRHNPHHHHRQQQQQQQHPAMQEEMFFELEQQQQRLLLQHQQHQQHQQQRQQAEMMVGYHTHSGPGILPLHESEVSSAGMTHNGYLLSSSPAGDAAAVVASSSSSSLVQHRQQSSRSHRHRHQHHRAKVEVNETKEESEVTGSEPQQHEKPKIEESQPPSSQSREESGIDDLDENEEKDGGLERRNKEGELERDPGRENEPSSTTASASASTGSLPPLCTYHMNGNCRYGGRCRFVHGSPCPVCGKNLLHPDDRLGGEEHIQHCGSSTGAASVVINTITDNKIGGEELDDWVEDEAVLSTSSSTTTTTSKEVGGSGEAAAAAAQSDALDVQNSQGRTCGLCNELIIETGKKFGLLSKCEHCFCLRCIREWRGTTDQPVDVVRTCPVCRKPSPFIIPSDVFPRNSETKESIIEGYRSKLYNIPCKYFDRGKGNCPFGSSCFYGHFLPNGSRDNGQRPRRYVDADGQLETQKTVTLSDYIDKLFEGKKGRKQKKNASHPQNQQTQV